MRFDPPLVRATLVRRYKRFLADIRFDTGEETTAHVANSGRMLGLDTPGFPVWVAPGTGKLAWSVRFVETPQGWAGVDTQAPNRLLKAALAKGRLEALSGWDKVTPETPDGAGNRFDFLLERGEERLWLEAKNVHLRRTPGLAEFPDCAAARSARHMRALADRVRAGDRACVCFVVQLDGVDRFTPAADLDPDFAAALTEARDAGVEVLAYACRMGPDHLEIDRRIDA